MWKFKASKFKNAVPKFPKKEEWITDISAANLLNSHGNHIQASAVYMTFNTDNGGDLGILPLETRGRQTSGSIPVIRAHRDFVTDFAFSPFDDYCLATASHDCSVKIWKLPEAGGDISHLQPEESFLLGEKRVETVAWHPTSSGLLSSSAADQIFMLDVNSKQQILNMSFTDDLLHSFSWRGDGVTMVTSSKNKTLRIIDPREKKVVMECSGHVNMRESRIIWLGNTDLILSSAFDNVRAREVCLRDCRNLSSTLSRKTFDTSSGALIPLYDADTGMLFLAGKGDTCLRYLEVTDKDIVENSFEMVEQIKGINLVPKRAMNVMGCELDRILLLTKHAIIPVPYCVPRKSMTEFHEDLFPETASNVAALTAQKWLAGQNQQVSRISLNPTRKPNLIVRGLAEQKSDAVTNNTEQKPTPASKPDFISKEIHVDADPPAQTEDVITSPVVMREKKNLFPGVRQSKFRHLEGVQLHKSQNIENIRNLCQTIPGESDMFQVNNKFCAVPLGGSAGLVAILKVRESGRLPDTGIPALQNSSHVSDFAWDPFNEHYLVVSCDDAKIRVWRIPVEGLTETLTKPEKVLLGHTEKIYFVRFHPLASGVLASGSYDMTVRIWDLVTGTERLQLQGHTDTIFCLTWRPDGRQCSTVCKDGHLRVYEPRESNQAIMSSSVPSGTRGARVVYACDSSLILVIGFEKISERSIRVYKAAGLSLLGKTELDLSPSILIPHYDDDSSTLFLTGRGDSLVQTFEVANEEPYLFPLTAHKTDGLHQAIAFLPKSACDVTKVQFSRALRLTANSIEQLAYTVPRVKTEYFQDDLFPETRVTWMPALSGSEWFAGENKFQKTINLRPENMELLSSAPVEAPKPKKYESFNPEMFKSDEQKKEELLKAMLGKFDLSEEPLPQDLTEGVDEDEWDD